MHTFGKLKARLFAFSRARILFIQIEHVVYSSLSLSTSVCSYVHAFSFTLSALGVYVFVCCVNLCAMCTEWSSWRWWWWWYFQCLLSVFCVYTTMYYILCVCTKARRTFLICSISQQLIGSIFFSLSRFRSLCRFCNIKPMLFVSL